MAGNSTHSDKGGGGGGSSVADDGCRPLCCTPGSDELVTEGCGHVPCSRGGRGHCQCVNEDEFTPIVSFGSLFVW